MNLTPEELVGRNIAAARTEKGGSEWLSQEALGQRLEWYLGKRWTKQAVSDAENGRRRFDPTELIAFAYALEISVTDLFAADSVVNIQLPGKVPDIAGEKLRWVIFPVDVARRLSIAEMEQMSAEMRRQIEELQQRVEALAREQR
jgi:hypothetical protein